MSRMPLPHQQNPVAAGHQAAQPNFDSDLTKSLDLVINIKENIHTILDSVGKSNRSNYEGSNETNNDEQIDDLSNLDTTQQLFYKETDTKYLQEKATELNTKLR
jgi:hypothetical protein